MVQYQNVDAILQDTENLLVIKSPESKRLEDPIMFELANPMANFSCDPTGKELLARAVAESLYLLSGMNGQDFISPFRFPKVNLVGDYYKYEGALGTELRFRGKGDELLNYPTSYNLRRTGTGFVDQLAYAVNKMKEGASEVTTPFSSVYKTLLVNIAKFDNNYGKLDMLVSANAVNQFKGLYCDVIVPFTFLHQIISDMTNIPLGTSKFIIGNLYSTSTYSVSLKGLVDPTPIINMQGFQYPKGNLTVQDVDALISIMVEFVDRLNENTISRANPFQGDGRVLMFSDYAEVFRAWKAEQLGYKVMMEQNFYHPQLRFIFKGEAI